MTVSLETLFPEESAIPANMDIEPLHQRRYLVNGKLREWSGATQEVQSCVCLQSADGPVQRVIGSYPLLGETEAKEVLAAASAAYGSGRGVWPTMAVEDRIRHVENFALKMAERQDEVVKLLMWEIGKSWSAAEKEFTRTVEYIRDTIEALKTLDRDCSRFVIEQGILAQIRRAPLGVVLCMGPYNYPLNETFTTLIPALIMGNTIIFKPPKLGVLLHEPLLEAFAECFPPGVVNTVYGDGRQVVGPLMESGDVSVLAFIGSSRVADILKQQHPKPHRLRCVLGLEAKNAGIVLADADLDLAVSECLLGSLSYNGQRCTALKMLFVHETIKDAFIERFVAGVDQLKMGMPWEEDVAITPLPDLRSAEFQQELRQDAMAQGATVLNQRTGAAATMVAPVVLGAIKPDMRLYREEQFGPTVPICGFDDLETPRQYLVESDYGQQVSIFGTNADQTAALIDVLVNQVCRVNLNSQCQRGPDTFPFTGRKDSAEGTLSVSDALRVFAIRTLVAAKGNPVNKALVQEIIRDRKSNFLSTDFLF